MCEIAVSREQRINTYKERIAENPDDKNARSCLRDNLNNWYEKDLRIAVQVADNIYDDQYYTWYEDDVEVIVQTANNEQLPWTTIETGLLMQPMLTKSNTGYDQTGDYVFTVYYKDRATTGGLVGERKSFPDLVGTLSDHEHFINLMQEVERFNKDDRFSIFKIYAECSKPEFMEWKPPAITHYKKFQKNENYVKKDEAKRLADWQAVMRGKIATLQARGASISWEGSRQEAALQFNNDVRHWCLKNYETIIGIEND